MGAFSGLGFGSSAALARTAEAMLRALGAGEAVLRFKGAALSDSTTANARLGLSTSSSDDISLSHAVVRDGGEGALEFVISGRAVQEQVEEYQVATAEALFGMALGVVYEGKLLRITGIGCDALGGTPYLYRLTARE